MDANEAPYLLGRVCRKWREISISTPSLWASIHIPVVYRRHPPLTPTENESISLRLIEAVKRWLDRSGTYPLEISLAEICMGPDGPDDDDDDPGAGLFQLLMQVSHRWKEIEYTGVSLLPRFIALAADDVPSLESFSVKVCHDQGRVLVSDGSPFTLFRAPRLHILRLVGMYRNVLDYQVTWSNLTELSIGGDSDDITLFVQSPVALTLLGRRKNLVSCRLNIAVFDTPQEVESRELVTLPYLTDLWITNTGESLVSFYQSLKTPALTHFEFGVRGVRTTESFPASALLSRSPLLEHLTLLTETLFYSNVVGCLQNAPFITTLIIKTGDSEQILITYGTEGLTRDTSHVVDDGFLVFLTPSLNVDKECLCPLLQHFEFDSRNSVTDEVLLHFIKSRTQHRDGSIGRLRTVSGSFWRPCTVNFAEQLSSEIADGLKLDLKHDRRGTVSPLTGVHWMDEDNEKH